MWKVDGYAQELLPSWMSACWLQVDLSLHRGQQSGWLVVLHKVICNICRRWKESNTSLGGLVVYTYKNATGRLHFKPLSSDDFQQSALRMVHGKGQGLKRTWNSLKLTPQREMRYMEQKKMRLWLKPKGNRGFTRVVAYFVRRGNSEIDITYLMVLKKT